MATLRRAIEIADCCCVLFIIFGLFPSFGGLFPIFSGSQALVGDGSIDTQHLFLSARLSTRCIPFTRVVMRAVDIILSNCILSISLALLPGDCHSAEMPSSSPVIGPRYPLRDAANVLLIQSNDGRFHLEAPFSDARLSMRMVFTRISLAQDEDIASYCSHFTSFFAYYPVILPDQRVQRRGKVQMLCGRPAASHPLLRSCKQESASYVASNRPTRLFRETHMPFSSLSPIGRRAYYGYIHVE
ncbi:hypothetical protein A0H81_14486 [Grifola frondosa]|uniref:Uncharacterized protein n=1 Tax=Grifola frondosa TaxID=5627 RepID=A0A1C7LLW3_GRIFR|nr:hypothetical protein A0H81_14486 [Grifola frondosa]